MSGVIKPRTVTITASGVDPPVMKILAGQDVTWENKDLLPHTVTPYSPAPIATGASFSYVFSTPGEYAYRLDNGASGTVVVDKPSNS